MTAVLLRENDPNGGSHAFDGGFAEFTFRVGGGRCGGEGEGGGEKSEGEELHFEGLVGWRRGRPCGIGLLDIEERGNVAELVGRETRGMRGSWGGLIYQFFEREFEVMRYSLTDRTGTAVSALRSFSLHGRARVHCASL